MFWPDVDRIVIILEASNRWTLGSDSDYVWLAASRVDDVSRSEGPEYCCSPVVSVWCFVRFHVFVLPTNLPPRELVLNEFKDAASFFY